VKSISDKFKKLLKYTGCYGAYTFLAFTLLIWAIGLMNGFDVETVALIWFLTTLFIIVATAYYLVSAPDDKDAFFAKLQDKGIKEASINCPDLQSFSVPKQTAKCPIYPKKIGPMEFTTSFYYLCNDSVTIYTKCAKYHIFKDEIKVEKLALRTVKTKKESCEEIFEFYYYDILYVTFEEKQIKFHFIDGSVRGFAAEKKPAKKVIEALRKKLREVAKRKTIHGYKKAFDVHVENFEKMQVAHTDSQKAVGTDGEEKS
jgi:hypothetical protein